MNIKQNNKQAEAIAGIIKNNFEERQAFRLGGIHSDINFTKIFKGYGEASDFNSIVVGGSGTGKRNSVRAFMLSVMYFARPGNLKIVVFDTRATVFAAASKLVNLVTTEKDIHKWIDELHKDMGRRFLEKEEERVCVIFDNYDGFCIKAKRTKEGRETLRKIEELLDKGLKLGIQFKLIMQVAGKEVVAQIMSNKFKECQFFGFSNLPHKGDEKATYSLRTGEFLVRQNERWVKFRSLYCPSEIFGKVCAEFEKAGYDYKLNKKITNE